MNSLDFTLGPFFINSNYSQPTEIYDDNLSSNGKFNVVNLKVTSCLKEEDSLKEFPSTEAFEGDSFRESSSFLNKILSLS